MGQPQKAAQIQQEAKKVTTVTIADFSDHFAYCPVYYFIDTNLALVSAGKLDGLILDANLKPLAEPPVKFSDDNYVIVYYGLPRGELGSDEIDDSPNNESVYRDKFVPREGLVVVGPNFKRKEKDHPYYLFDFYFIKRGSRGTKYSYNSKIIGAGYYPFASALSTRLEHIPKRYFRNKE